MILKAILGLSGAILGQFWAILGHLGPSWGHLGAILDHLGPILGPSWGYLGTILGPSRTILGHPGAILGHLGAILGPSWGRLGPPWGHLSWAILGPSRDISSSLASPLRLVGLRLEASSLRIGLGGIREALTIRPHSVRSCRTVLNPTMKPSKKVPPGSNPAEAGTQLFSILGLQPSKMHGFSMVVAQFRS